MEQGEGYVSTEGDVASSKESGLLRTQTVVSKYLLPGKGSPGLLREEADSRTGARRARHISCCCKVRTGLWQHSW